MKYLDTFNESFYSKDRIARKIKADTDSAIVYLIDDFIHVKYFLLFSVIICNAKRINETASIIIPFD